METWIPLTNQGPSLPSGIIWNEEQRPVTESRTQFIQQQLGHLCCAAALNSQLELWAVPKRSQPNQAAARGSQPGVC